MDERYCLKKKKILREIKLESMGKREKKNLHAQLEARDRREILRLKRKKLKEKRKKIHLHAHIEARDGREIRLAGIQVFPRQEGSKAPDDVTFV